MFMGETQLTPSGTQFPATVVPGVGLRRGNPCEPGGYMRKPSEMTACKYGSLCVAAAVMLA